MVESISASEKSSTNRYVNRAGERLMIVCEERKKCMSGPADTANVPADVPKDCRVIILQSVPEKIKL